MPALGERFRAAREARGLSLSEVAEQIRIRSVYLGEIEAENWAAIGAPVYVRGFLRTYARFLGLDAEEAVAEFNKTAEGAPVADGTGLSGSSWSGSERRNLSPLLWVASAIAAILIGFVIYNFVMLRQPSTRALVSASPLPSNSAQPASGAPSSRPAPLGHTLAIHLSSGSWLRVMVDGNVSIEGVFPKGTSKQFHGKKALVRVGNAGGVDIVVNGHAVPKLGKVGDVAEQSFTL